MNEKTRMTLSSPIITVQQHILQEQQRVAGASGEFSWLLSGITMATKLIQAKVRRAGLSDILGEHGNVNVQGEVQQKLDVYSNEVLIHCLSARESIGVLASEENEEPLLVHGGSENASYAVVFDPLDGSSNIDVNVSVGTTFSILRRPEGVSLDESERWVLQPGSQQIAAGYVVYGSSTILVYSVGNGVHGFTLDPAVGAYILSHPDIRMPEQGRYYSVNEAYCDSFPPRYQEYIARLRSGELGHRYSSRYIGSMVADFHRTLLKGGVFLYPPTTSNTEGKLRLLYEANPVAFLAEQAGGMAIDGTRRVLDIHPDSIHQRTPLVVGSRVEVADFQQFVGRHHQSGARSMNRQITHPRDEIMQTMSRIYRYRMTTTSGGNLSIRDENGDVWISPARVDKGNLTRSDIVCVKADGSVEGPHPPSSEFPFHQAVYESRPDIRAIVHAHPVALVAFSICGQQPDTRLFHQAHSVCGRIGFAPYALPGSRQLGSNIAATFRECDSVILENHGVVVGGQSLSEAFQRFEAFEFAAKTIIKGRQLGEIRCLTDQELDLAHNRTVALESFQPRSATASEKELRSQLRAFIRRGCQQRLLISTEGSFSARLSEDAFVITPTQRDRELLDISDFVLVQGGKRQIGRKASRAVFAHQAIYRRHPSVQAIVFAHPVNATAFSVTDSTFDARTIPESYIFLRDVKRVPYGVQYQNDGSIADFVSVASPAAILENDGVLVTGSSVLDTFDRLEVLESTAEAIINAGALGKVVTMSDAVIDELRTVFGLSMN